ncbi:MAG: UDP-N-acetylmuramate dehydrogenase [Nitrospirae bacterium]|nr:UDP-N-acetylmuramate dehydrogenase [Nitrospirota bacterium]
MSDKEIKEIFETGLFIGRIKFDEPMSAHTSLKIGGPVEIMIFPEDVVSLKNVLVVAKMQKIPVFVLGAGTNLLVRDKGLEGIAISLKAFKKIEVIQDDTEKNVSLFAEAGVLLKSLINFTKERGYSGMEALSGIPGMLGGAVYMNAGSFGTEIMDMLSSIAVISMDGMITMLNREEIKFSYRSSNLPDDLIILSANVALRKDTPDNVSRRAREFLKKKVLTQPLKERSAGCVFKNPAQDSAGRLIDAAGCKGMRLGDAEVSMLHANYFINRGRASSKDFIELMEAVKIKVKEYSGITLEPEIKIIGREK